jgi:hypothetical protein
MTFFKGELANRDVGYRSNRALDRDDSLGGTIRGTK